ncbi:MAG: hypothetical protein ACHREM_11065 [Polyangiales bacterium]
MITTAIALLAGLVVGFGASVTAWLIAGRVRSDRAGSGSPAPIVRDPTPRHFTIVAPRAFRRADRSAPPTPLKSFVRTAPEGEGTGFRGAVTQAPNAPCRFCGKALAEGEHAH